MAKLGLHRERHLVERINWESLQRSSTKACEHVVDGGYKSSGQSSK